MLGVQGEVTWGPVALPWLFDLCLNSFLLMIFPVPCTALLRPLLITEERKEREEFEEEEGRVVGCWVREAELRLKFKIEDDGGLLPANDPIIQKKSTCEHSMQQLKKEAAHQEKNEKNQPTVVELSQYSMLNLI